jgi:hypothetical protein
VADSVLRLGDRFVAVGREAITWAVEACFDVPGGIRHVRLQQIGASHIQRTFSEKTLLDPRTFKRTSA